MIRAALMKGLRLQESQALSFVRLGGVGLDLGVVRLRRQRMSVSFGEVAGVLPSCSPRASGEKVLPDALPPKIKL